MPYVVTAVSEGWRWWIGTNGYPTPRESLARRYETLRAARQAIRLIQHGVYTPAVPATAWVLLLTPVEVASVQGI